MASQSLLRIHGVLRRSVCRLHTDTTADGGRGRPRRPVPVQPTLIRMLGLDHQSADYAGHVFSRLQGRRLDIGSPGAGFAVRTQLSLAGHTPGGYLAAIFTGLPDMRIVFRQPGLLCDQHGLALAGGKTLARARPQARGTRAGARYRGLSTEI